MNYWLTIHWPPFEDERFRTPELEIQYDPLDLGFMYQLNQGDWIFVYHTKSGPPCEVNGKLIKRIKEPNSGVKALYTVKYECWLERMAIGRRWGKW